MELNVLDIVFAGLIVAFTLISMMRGAMREVLSLIGLLGGFLLASRFYGVLADKVEPIMPDRALGELLSFLAILVAGYVAGSFLSGFGDLFGPKRRGLLDRLLGAVFGFCKGTTVSLALFWVIKEYIPPFQDELAGSLLAETLGQLFSLLSGLDLI